MRMGFRVNFYDKDGDVTGRGVLLHIDDRTILQFKDSTELKNFAEDILLMLPEIKENENNR